MDEDLGVIKGLIGYRRFRGFWSMGMSQYDACMCIYWLI